MRGIDDDEFGLIEKDYIKMRHESPGSGQIKHNGLDSNVYSILGNCRLGNAS